MEWATLIALVIQEGAPLAFKLAEKWGSKDAVKPEEWAELKALAAQTPQTQMRDAILRAGLNPNDPEAKALLSLVGGQTGVSATVSPLPGMQAPPTP